MASDAPDPTVNAKPRTTKRSTAAKKGTATRATKRTATGATTRRQAATKTEAAAKGPQSTIERAALTSVGVVLTARDSVEKTVADLRSTYGTPTKRAARLKTFERRGSTARSALERDVKQARTRVGNAVETAQLAGATVVAKVSERVASLA